MTDAAEMDSMHCIQTTSGLSWGGLCLPWFRGLLWFAMACRGLPWLVLPWLPWFPRLAVACRGLQWLVLACSGLPWFAVAFAVPLGTAVHGRCGIP